MGCPHMPMNSQSSHELSHVHPSQVLKLQIVDGLGAFDDAINDGSWRRSERNGLGTFSALPRNGSPKMAILQAEMPMDKNSKITWFLHLSTTYHGKKEKAPGITVPSLQPVLQLHVLLSNFTDKVQPLQSVTLSRLFVHIASL